MLNWQRGGRTSPAPALFACRSGERSGGSVGAAAMPAILEGATGSARASCSTDPPPNAE